MGQVFQLGLRSALLFPRGGVSSLVGGGVALPGLMRDGASSAQP